VLPEAPEGRYSRPGPYQNNGFHGIVGQMEIGSSSDEQTDLLPDGNVLQVVGADAVVYWTFTVLRFVHYHSYC
jgi:hypothetical protein